MKLVRWSPLEEMTILRDQIDRIFEPLSSSNTSNVDSGLLNHTFPVEVTEKPENYFIRVLAPGINPDKIDLQCSSKEVLISTEILPRKLDKDEVVLVGQFHYGKFNKQLSFVEPIDESKVEAKYEHGILEITLPKAESSKRKPIEIQIKQ